MPKKHFHVSGVSSTMPIMHVIYLTPSEALKAFSTLAAQAEDSYGLKITRFSWTDGNSGHSYPVFRKDDFIISGALIKPFLSMSVSFDNTEEHITCYACEKPQCVSNEDDIPSKDPYTLKRARDLMTPEKLPMKNSNFEVWNLVLEDMRQRDQFGREKYGMPLRPFNGRDSLKDAYQEALDLVVYLRQTIFERDGR